MSEFDGLRSVDDWVRKLDQLLDEAHGAKTSSERVAMQGRLRAFRRASPPRPVIQDLDDIAEAAIHDIAAAAVGEAVLQIASRSAELDSIAKNLNNIASETARTANWIALEPAIETTKSLTELLQSAKALKNSYDKAGLSTELVKKAEGLVGAIEKLRGTVESELL